jgi:hypothetical protein
MHAAWLDAGLPYCRTTLRRMVVDSNCCEPVSGLFHVIFLFFAAFS